MKTTKLNGQWIRAHWKTDTKRHWRKRTVAKRGTVAKRAPVGDSGAKRAPVGPVGESPHGSMTPAKTPRESNDVDRYVAFRRPVGVELVADFKKRLAAIQRFKDTGKIYSVIGAAHADPCVVRPKRRGRASSG